jgi:hypothetical protein
MSEGGGMSTTGLRARLDALGADVVAEATGRLRRPDPVAERTGGPAGNVRLTAWLGMLLLVLFLAELVTLLDVRGLISWHLAIGVLLIPPALVKTGSTGWRMVRYYAGHRQYRRAGPPPLALRILGPLVVLSSLAVLGSGLALALVGPTASRRSLLDVLGRHLDAVMLHKAAFVVCGVVTGLHVLARLFPALRVTMLRDRSGHGVAGRSGRLAVLVLTMAVAAATAVLVLGAAGAEAWRHEPERHFAPQSGTVQPPALTRRP